MPEKTFSERPQIMEKRGLKINSKNGGRDTRGKKADYSKFHYL